MIERICIYIAFAIVIGTMATVLIKNSIPVYVPSTWTPPIHYCGADQPIVDCVCNGRIDGNICRDKKG